MKTSRRLMLGTLIVLLAIPVTFLAWTRIAGTSQQGLPVPQRTPAPELAALRDFSSIDISGDLHVEIVSAADYSIDYRPLAENRGNFTARVEDGTLHIQAFGNRAEPFAAATVRIGMPELASFNAEFLYSLAVRDFDTDAMRIEVTATIGDIVIENNRIAALTLDIQRTNDVALRNNTIGTTSLTHYGTTVTTE